MAKKAVLYFFLFTLFLIIFKIVLHQDNLSKINKVNNIPKCNDLDYSKGLFLHPHNFQKINLNIIINDNRRWKTLLLEEEIQAKARQIKFNSNYKFYETRKRVDAKIIVTLGKQSNCYVNARIRPHGDLEDHRSEDFLPSLNVNLVDGHIFGIVKFILLKPITRGYDNEIITATILNELNFLSPRTANFLITYNGSTKKFIFQEKIVKEFIEINNQLENPVYRGDERFTFSDKQKYNIQRSIFNHQFKPINEKFLTKGKNEKYITEFGISILNELVLYDQADVDADDLIDLVGSSNKTIYQDKFDNFKIFDAILLSMDATHGFTPGNRRIYYDSTLNTFSPVYYDGQPDIVDKNNKILKKKFIDGDKIPIIYENPNIYFPGIFKGKVPKSLTNSSSKAIDLISKISVSNLNERLKIRGVEIKEQTLKDYLNQILINLNYLQKMKSDKLIQSDKSENNLIYIKDVNIFKNLFSTEMINKIDRLLVFYGNSRTDFLACNILSENCKKIDIPPEKIPDLISQKLKEKKKNLIFLGKNKESDIFDGWFGKKEFNKLNQVKNLNTENFKIKKFGSIKININSKEKKIDVVKTGSSGKLLIYNGNINNWIVDFVDNTKIEKSKIDRRDKYGLTGCVTFLNLKIENLKVNTKNAKCEDSINFIRSNGNVNEINVSNALFDGLDGDFSNLKFNKINIDNSGNDCSDFSFGKYVILNSSMSYCGDKGISAGEISKVKVKKFIVNNSVSAVTSKDFATVEIENFSSNYTKYCLQGYNKKPEFSGGFIKIINFTCNNYSKLIDIDKRSKVEIVNR